MSAPVAAAGRMSERRTSLVGAVLVAIGPISMALYTPAMPTLVEAFASDEATIKLTLSVFFGGFALTQLVCGPMSDAFGRRITTAIFMGIYLVGSLMAVMAPSVEWLLAARLLQGIGASVGVAISRAIVRDQFTGETSSRIMNTIGMILAVGPALAPSLGGFTLGLAGWHAIFVLMVIFGVIAAALVFGYMRETTVPDRSLLQPKTLLRAYLRLATSSRFMSASLAAAFSVGALYTLATVLPFVLMDGAKLTPTQFGLGMLAQSGMFFLGSLMVRFAMPRFGAERLVPVGLAFIALGSLFLALSIATLEVSYLSIMGPVGIYAFGIAFVMPAMTTAALAPFPRMAGAASAVLGFLQMGSGLVGGAVAALIGEPVLATQIVVPALGLISVLSYFVYRSLPVPKEPALIGAAELPPPDHEKG